MATVIIDPGHGGSADVSGSSANRSVGRRGTTEKQLALDIGRRLAGRMQSSGHRVALTRSGDSNRTAADRAALARQERADAFVSIHFNASADPHVQGTEVLLGGNSVAEPDWRSRRLARGIREQMAQSLSLPDRGVKIGNWFVLDESLHDPGTARCIVEVCYLTDPDEEARLGDEEYRERIAGALARGLEEGLPSLDETWGSRGQTRGHSRPTTAALGRRPAGQGLQAPDWCQIRFGIVKSADEEQGFWLDASGKLMTEGDAAVLPMLEKYWRDGARVADWKQRAQGSAADKPAYPWSAAFVSWVMTNAGVPDGAGFDFSPLHMTYIVGALRNREGKRKDRPFWLYTPTEVPVVPGDLVCRNRKIDGVWTTHSYDSLKKSFWDNGNDKVVPTGASHSDVAIGYAEIDGQRTIEVVGGNADHTTEVPHVSNTVGSKRLDVDDKGFLTSPDHVFGIIKLIECPDGQSAEG